MSLSTVVVRLMVPIDGTPTAPNDVIKNTLGILWGYVGWFSAVVAMFGLAGCAILAWSKWRSNDSSNEGVTKAGWVCGGAVAFGMIGGLVGIITGT